MIKNLNMDHAQKMQRCKYVDALEEERSKIQVFRRELPLCLELVTQAIVACKRELSSTTTEYVHAQSECSEQTTGECGPVLEEFIPIKRSPSRDEDDEHASHEPKTTDDKIASNMDMNKKSDWLRSVQLWNHSSDSFPNEENVPKEMAVDEKISGGAFQPFRLEKSLSGGKIRKPVVVATSSTSSGGGQGKKESEKDDHKRKQRRCWSPELHRRFVDALQQLGGSHVATPKQIKELMKVDGLTNDEVKSHLQKYRLHTKKPSQTVANGSSRYAPPHFVLVGGSSVPRPDYPARPTNGIYAAATATRSSAPAQWPSQTRSGRFISSEDRSGSRIGRVQCNSPDASSSTRSCVKQS